MVLTRRFAVELALLCLVGAACGSSDDDVPDTPEPDAGIDHVAAEPDVHPSDDAGVASDTGVVDAPVEAAPVDAACNAVAAAQTIQQPTTHVPEGTAITYSTNPPSSGPHYPVWANFVEYDHPVADGYLVHSMEHGAVVLLYDCDPAACTAPSGVVEALRAVRDQTPTDPLCEPSIRVRIIIAPRPANDVPIAAAAWGATYRADCVDAPSLSKFVADHYAMGPENFCSPGMTL